MIMYFILYCTGMRISELCQLKVDCLAVIKNKYLIKYYQPKMKKEVFNPIPEALYYLIEKRANSLVENKSEYLFPSPANKNIPMSRQYFTEEMQELLKPFNIKKPDGSEYIFRGHDYRHTIATDLLERDIPTHIIQKALHHESPEMTLAYAEYRDDRRRRKFKEFVNIRGEYEPIKDYITEEVYITTEWLRINIRAQALPNGFCGIPVKMGECPNANACLECDYFRTTVQHLAIHKKHLAQTEIILEKSIQNGWLAQIETNQKVKQNLINIINKLELELKEGGCHNETKKS